MATHPAPNWLLGALVGLGVLGFGSLILVTGEVAGVWLAGGTVAAATAVLALTLAPEAQQYAIQGGVVFGGAAAVLWIVFEVQPPLGTYASGSLGVVLGGAVGWLVGRQL